MQIKIYLILVLAALTVLSGGIPIELQAQVEANPASRYETPCGYFRNGRFSYMNPDKKGILVRRRGKRYVEFNQTTGEKAVYKILWSDSTCGYNLIFKKSNQESKLRKGWLVEVTIPTTGSDYYTYSADTYGIINKGGLKKIMSKAEKRRKENNEIAAALAIRNKAIADSIAFADSTKKVVELEKIKTGNRIDQMVRKTNQEKDDFADKSEVKTYAPGTVKNTETEKIVDPFADIHKELTVEEKAALEEQEAEENKNKGKSGKVKKGKKGAKEKKGEAEPNDKKSKGDSESKKSGKKEKPTKKVKEKPAKKEKTKKIKPEKKPKVKKEKAAKDKKEKAPKVKKEKQAKAKKARTEESPGD